MSESSVKAGPELHAGGQGVMEPPAGPAPLTVKEKARQAIDRLPDDATWENVEFAVFLAERLEQNEADVAAGRAYTTDEVRRRLGLTES